MTIQDNKKVLKQYIYFAIKPSEISEYKLKGWIVTSRKNEYGLIVVTKEK